MTSKTVTMKTVEYDRMIAGENTLREELTKQYDEVKRLRAAAMKLNNYLVSDTYDPATKNVTVRLAEFVDLRDLLGLTPWQPPTDA